MLDLTTAHEARKLSRDDYCSTCNSQMQRGPKVRVSATLAQEPEIELTLA